MTDDENEFKEIVDAVLEDQGVDSVDELKQTQAWKEAFSRENDKGEALRALARPVDQDVVVPGWFLTNFTVTEWGPNGPEDKGMSPRVLTAEGHVMSIENYEPLDVPFFTEVEVGPMTVKRDVVRGTRRVKTDDEEINVDPTDHAEDHEIPDLPIGWAIEHCNSIDKQRNSQRGVWNLEIGRWNPIHARLTIGEYDEIVYYAPDDHEDEGTLKANATDSQGHTVEVKIDPSLAQEKFGLAVDDEMDRYKEALQNQPILAAGILSTSHQIGTLNFDPFSDDISEAHWQTFADGSVNPQAPDAEVAAEALVECFNDNQMTDFGSTTELEDGTEYQRKALDLRMFPEDARAIEVGGKHIYDIVEQSPHEWTFQSHVDKMGKLPKLNTIERSGTRDDGSTWYFNEGAFCAFLSSLGAEVEDQFTKAAEQYL